jgi:hypothetical protein
MKKRLKALEAPVPLCGAGLALIAAARSATVEFSDVPMPRVFSRPWAPFDPSALVLVKRLSRHNR